MNKPLFDTAIILAGGESKRMGFDKQFLMLEEERLMKLIMEQLTPLFDDFIIVTNKPEKYEDFEAEIASDYFVGKGPLAGIHAGLLNSTSQYSFVLACDMPQVNLPLIRYQQNILKNKDYDALVTETPDRKLNPFHGFYSKTLIESLERTLTGRKLQVNNFLLKHEIYTLTYNTIERFMDPNLLFTNLNTQKDVENYLNKVLK